MNLRCGAKNSSRGVDKSGQKEATKRDKFSKGKKKENIPQWKRKI